MRKVISFILISVLLLLIPGCRNTPSISSPEEAKNVLISHTPEAIILDCVYDENTTTYKIEYKTEYDSYIALINSASGKISISPKSAFKTEDPTLFPDQNNNIQQLTLSYDGAYALAVLDAGNANMSYRSQEDYIEENNTYFVAFYLLDYEYTYIIDATTQEILQKTKTDTETGEILEYRKKYSETGEILHYIKNISEDGTVSEKLTTYTNIEEFMLYNTSTSSDYAADETSPEEDTLPSAES